MKRRLFAVIGVLLLTTVPVTASQGGPKPKSPKPAASVSAPKAQVTKVKPVSVKTTQHAKPPKPVKATAVKPAKSTSVKPATSTTKATKPAKTTKAAKAETKSTKRSTTSTASATTSTPTDPTVPDETVPLTKVQQKLQQNTNLADKLERRLPPGTDLMEAAEGFKNIGQFVAAVNVSNNLGISFDSLKTNMVDEGYSLGQSIQRVKAEADATVEARRAEADAQRMIAESEGPVTTTATTTKAKAKKKTVGGQQ